jgi:hypothetical protein
MPKSRSGHRRGPARTAAATAGPIIERPIWWSPQTDIMEMGGGIGTPEDRQRLVVLTMIRERIGSTSALVSPAASPYRKVNN